MGIRSITAFLLFVICVSAVARTLNFYTFHAPPYQTEANTMISNSSVLGTTVDTVRCVTSRMGWNVRIRAVPQNRAMHSLRIQLIDGYFAIDETEALDQVAFASDPIALEKWYFFSLGPITDFKAAHIGTVAGSNEALWLEDREFSNVLPVSSAPQLIELLKRGRVDAIVLDQQVLDDSSLFALERLQLQADALESDFIRFAPLHLYLTKSFTSLNPGFLSEFNNLLGECVTVGFKLNEHETQLAHHLAAYLLSDLQAKVDLKANIANRQAFSSLSEILNFDSKWQALAPGQPSELAAKLLNLPTSRSLATWQNSLEGLVTETFVMDEMGTVTALSQLTSDFWQGDEEYFTATVRTAPGDITLTPLQYDHSARRFQLTASTPVYDTTTGELIGAVAIGLDIELVLQTSNGASLLFQPE